MPRRATPRLREHGVPEFSPESDRSVFRNIAPDIVCAIPGAYAGGMARRIVHQLVDDIDGTVLGIGEGETVHFSLNNTAYEIDLTTENADAFREALEPYIAGARRASASTARSGSTRKRSARSCPTARARRGVWSRLHPTVPRGARRCRTAPSPAGKRVARRTRAATATPAASGRANPAPAPARRCPHRQA